MTRLLIYVLPLLLQCASLPSRAPSSGPSLSMGDTTIVTAHVGERSCSDLPEERILISNPVTHQSNPYNLSHPYSLSATICVPSCSVQEADLEHLARDLTERSKDLLFQQIKKTNVVIYGRSSPLPPIEGIYATFSQRIDGHLHHCGFSSAPFNPLYLNRLN